MPPSVQEERKTSQTVILHFFFHFECKENSMHYINNENFLDNYHTHPNQLQNGTAQNSIKRIGHVKIPTIVPRE